jgi:hypothetical protein
MARRDWYIGVLLLALALLAHALVPRYEWQAVAGEPRQLIRVDRWTGTAEHGTVYSRQGWMPMPRP